MNSNKSIINMDNVMKNKRRFKVQVNAPLGTQKHKQLHQSYGGANIQGSMPPNSNEAVTNARRAKESLNASRESNKLSMATPGTNSQRVVPGHGYDQGRAEAGSHHQQSLVMNSEDAVVDQFSSQPLKCYGAGSLANRYMHQGGQQRSMKDNMVPQHFGFVATGNKNMVALSPHAQKTGRTPASSAHSPANILGITSQISEPGLGSLFAAGTIQSSRTPASLQQLSGQQSPQKERQKSISKRQSRNASKKRGSEYKSSITAGRGVLSGSGSRANADSSVRNDHSTNARAHYDKTKTTGPKVSVRHNAASKFKQPQCNLSSAQDLKNPFSSTQYANFGGLGQAKSHQYSQMQSSSDQHVNQITQNTQNVHNNFQIIIQNPHTFSVSSGSGSFPIQGQSPSAGSVPAMHRSQNFQMENYKNIPLKMLKNKGANPNQKNQKFTKAMLEVRSPKPQIAGLQSATGLLTGFTASAGGILMTGQEAGNQSLHQIPIPRKQSNLKNSSVNTIRDTSIKSSQTRINKTYGSVTNQSGADIKSSASRQALNSRVQGHLSNQVPVNKKPNTFKVKKKQSVPAQFTKGNVLSEMNLANHSNWTGINSHSDSMGLIPQEAQSPALNDVEQMNQLGIVRNQGVQRLVSNVASVSHQMVSQPEGLQAGRTKQNFQLKSLQTTKLNSSNERIDANAASHSLQAQSANKKCNNLKSRYGRSQRKSQNRQLSKQKISARRSIHENQNSVNMAFNSLRDNSEGAVQNKLLASTAGYKYPLQADMASSRQANQYQMPNGTYVSNLQANPVQYRTVEHELQRTFVNSGYAQSQGLLEQLSVQHVGPKFSISGTSSAVNNPIKSANNQQINIFEKSKHQVAIKQKIKKQIDQQATSGASMSTNRQKQSMRKQQNQMKYPNSLSPKNEPTKFKTTKPFGQYALQARTQQHSGGPNSVLVKQPFGPSNETNFSKMLGSSESSSYQHQNKTIDNSAEPTQTRPIQQGANNFSSLHEAHKSIRSNQKEFKHLKNQRFRGSMPIQNKTHAQGASEGDKSGQDSFELHTGMIQAIDNGYTGQQQLQKHHDLANLTAINVSRINKNFSPISILDNSQHVVSQMGGFVHNKGYTQKVSQGNSVEKLGRVGGLQPNTDEFNFRDASEANLVAQGSNREQQSQVGKAPNLSEQIRKVNKIQIKKRYTNEPGKPSKDKIHYTDRGGLATDKSNMLANNFDANSANNEIWDGDVSPLQIIMKAQHALSMNKESIDTVLQLLLKYVSIEPCDPIIHFQIAMIYRYFTLGGYKIVQADNRDVNQEEALLHFEQVIKHSCSTDDGKTNARKSKSKTVIKDLIPGLMNLDEDCNIAVVSLFEISKIYIEQKDFYQAEHCLCARAVHYGWLSNDQSFEQKMLNQRFNDTRQSNQIIENNDTLDSKPDSVDQNFTYDSGSNIFEKIKVYQKVVKAIIHLMKRKTDKALILFESIKVPVQLGRSKKPGELKIQDSELDMAAKEYNDFWYMYFSNRAYAYILAANYDHAIGDLLTAKQFTKDQQLDQSSKFNLQLCTMLREQRLQFKKQCLKLPINVNQDKKLAMIEQIEQQFPGSACKEIYKYHSIYLVQVQALFEIARSEKDERRVFAELIKEVIQQHSLQNMAVRQRKEGAEELLDQNLNLKEVAVAAKQLRRNRSQLFQITSGNRGHMNSGDDSSNNNKMNQEQRLMQGGQFYEKIATCNVDNPVKFQVIQQALKIINVGLEYNPTDRNLLLTRSYILYYFHNFYEALCDIDAVIELERASSGEEEPNATDLLHKGRCHACLSMFKEAITDFTKVIELDDELFDAYFFRGKCAYLIGDTSQAFLDFQKLILLQPKNPMVHAYAGNLLMTTGSYEDAAKAFTNADSVQSCAFAIYQRARCFLAIGEVNRTLKDLDLATQMYERNSDHNQHKIHQNAIVLRDKQCLQSIIDAMQILQNLSTDEVFDPKEHANSKEREKLKNTAQRPQSTKQKVSSQQLDTQQLDSGGNESNFQIKDKFNLNNKEPSNGSSSIYQDDDQEDARKPNYVVHEKILCIKSAQQKEILKGALSILIQGMDDIMAVQNIELRDINNPMNSGQNIEASTNQSKNELVEEVAFHLTKSASMFNNATQDSRMQQQIIPNVTRIKIEKLRALRRYQAKHQRALHNRAQKKKSSINLLVFNLDDDPVDQEMKENASKICPWSYYMENLFSLDDIYLYRAVLKFYAEDFQGAIKDFKKSFKTKQKYKILDNENQQGNDQLEQLSSACTGHNQQSSSNLQNYEREPSNAADSGPNRQKSTLLDRQTLRSVETDEFADKRSPKSTRNQDKTTQEQQEAAEERLENQSDKTDLSDVGLCSMNKCEMLYNITLCCLQLHDLPKARKYLDKLMAIAPQKYHKNLLELLKIVDQLAKTGSSQLPSARLIEPFNSQHRLCRYFPCMPFFLKSHGNNITIETNSPTEPQADFVARPSFSFPFVKPPNMIPNVDESILWSEFGPDRDDANIPQPWPLWIKSISDKEPARHTSNGLPKAAKQRKKAEDPTPTAFQFTDTMLQPSESMQSQSYSHLSEVFPDMFGPDGPGSKMQLQC